MRGIDNSGLRIEWRMERRAGGGGGFLFFFAFRSVGFFLFPSRGRAMVSYGELW